MRSAFQHSAVHAASDFCLWRAANLTRRPTIIDGVVQSALAASSAARLDIVAICNLSLLWCHNFIKQENATSNKCSNTYHHGRRRIGGIVSKSMWYRGQRDAPLHLLITIHSNRIVRTGRKVLEEKTWATQKTRTRGEIFCHVLFFTSYILLTFTLLEQTGRKQLEEKIQAIERTNMWDEPLLCLLLTLTCCILVAQAGTIKVLEEK